MQIKTTTKTFTFPAWQTKDKTYSEAVNQTLKEIKKTRPFYSLLKIASENIRETERKQEMIKQCTKDGLVAIDVQLGEKYKGKSVKEARELFENNEFGLGAYEVGQILLQEPDILEDFNSLWLDCAGDEFEYPGDNARFGHAPCFDFSYSKVSFSTLRVGHACGHCGSVAAFIPQNLETRNIDTSDNLKLDQAIKLLKDNGYKIIIK